MSFRGRGGRGGGRGGRGGRGGANFNFQAKHAPHEDFPEITLPDMTVSSATNEEKALIQSTLHFEDFMRNSCYHLELEAPKKKNEDREIERFSDKKRKSRSKREALASYLRLTKGNFPEELLKGYTTKAQPVKKKLRWDKDSDEKFEAFEKAMQQDGENKTEKDDEDEEKEEEEEVEVAESSDDDYNQNVEFDDDDDDWNQAEEAHEDCYD